MTFSRPITLCFDLDGTLVDTAPDLVRVLNLVIAEDGLPETDYAIASRQVGFGARVLIRDAFARASTPLKNERADELLALFLKLYAEDIAQLSQPFPHVLSTLRELRRQQVRLTVCTNKPGYLARPLIEALNMTHYFERIIGSGDGAKSKPSPDLIYAAAGHKRRDEIVMVGDATPDAAAARAAGVPVIIVTYGYSDVPVAKLRANVNLRSFRDLPAALVGLGS